MKPVGLTVTPESIATAGAISYWRMSGPVSLAYLTQMWVQAGLPVKLLPTPPAEEVALGRAVREQAAKRRLVRPLAKRGAWAVVDETVSQTGDLSYTQLVRVTKTLAPVPLFEYDDQADTVGDAVTVVDAIEKAFVRHQGELDPEDISAWLIKLAFLNSAITLRDSGGIYFVPRTAMAFWRDVVRVVESVSVHRVFMIPAMKNSEAIDAITEALTAEADRAVAVLTADLMKTGEEALGARALATREKECATLLAKVSSYETLLGVQMKCRERVAGLQASVAMAALLAGSVEHAA